MARLTQNRESTRSRAASAAGYSLVELMVVVLIMFIVAGFAIIGIQGALPNMRANASLNQMVAQLRTARETAISQRRNIRVEFIGNNQIRLTRQDFPAGTTVLNTATLEGGSIFQVFAGIADTPDGFGNSSAIDFGGSPTMMFLSDGVFVDTNGVPLNGSVFLGNRNMPATARAITILGATGRIRAYKWTGEGWIE